MAKQQSLTDGECPVARTLEAIGERWCMMIIREAFDDVRRFSEFQKNLGLVKNILASRLKQLVNLGVFEICPASDGSAYKEYVLTERGRAAFPIVVAMRQWGERYMFERGEVRCRTGRLCRWRCALLMANRWRRRIAIVGEW